MAVTVTSSCTLHPPACLASSPYIPFHPLPPTPLALFFSIHPTFDLPV